MKKIILPLIAMSVLVACGGGGSKDEKKGELSTTDISENPDYKKGLALIAENDCLTCHKIDEVLTGPSYRDIANKYAGDSKAVSYLTEKIISGGTGVWGTAMMTPHGSLPKEEAEAMAKYILLLKK